ncbi:DNA photolyase [Fragilaria crotonensis]|nr:DNA photolyase [Fragilaria crotonensis]
MVISPKKNCIHWFRKGLRLTDNPALVDAIHQNPSYLYPVYVMDGDSYQLLHCTALRANFLVECLQDLDTRLRAKGSRLFVASGDPRVVLPELWKQWNIDYMTYEEDESGEEYASQRDNDIQKLAKKCKVELKSFASETIHPLKTYVAKAGNNIPNTMGGFQKVFASAGRISKPLDEPLTMPPIPSGNEDKYLPPKRPTDLPWPRSVPRAQVTPSWTVKDCVDLKPLVRGGETIALRQLASSVTSKPTYVATFEKPLTSPTALTPSTTGLSPYMSLGCLSPRTVWFAIEEAIQRSSSGKRTQPPVSLHGQLLWRDFNNLMAHSAGSNWGKMDGNKYCRPIPWSRDEKLLEAWKNGQTGYPWIDACMIQLKQEGWIHHLGRHAVACFLTRGDLWQSWEEGALHFESHLLDADYSLNGFNWLWLSCSGFFYQYFRCYSPVAFQQKKDPSGLYIRTYLPALAKLPDKYIYEPWKAPVAVQKTAGVKIGVDYPKPIVDHGRVSKENMAKMAEAYSLFNMEATASKQSKKAKATNSSVDSPPPKKQKQSKLKF